MTHVPNLQTRPAGGDRTRLGASRAPGAPQAVVGRSAHREGLGRADRADRGAPMPRMRRTARRSLGRVLGLPVAVLVVAAALPLTAAQAVPPAGDGVPPQPPSSPCGNAQPITGQDGAPASAVYDPVAAPLALPNWSDGGGWLNASQYSTILSGDIDGDGVGELLGRNGDTVESWTVAPPERPAGQAPFVGSAATLTPPSPNQWVPKTAVNPPPPGVSPNQPYVPEGSTNAEILGTHQNSPTSGAVPGFSDPSRYTTFRLANVDGQPGDELIVRQPRVDTTQTPPRFLGTFLTFYKYKNGAWSVPMNFILLDDRTGPNYVAGPQKTDPSLGLFGTPWFLPQYYTDITTGDIDGDGRDEIIARAADGLHEWAWADATADFGEINDTTNGGGNRLFQDAQGFDQAPSYNTLRVADFDGDGRDEVAMWDSGWSIAGGGMLVARWQPGAPQGGVKQGSWGWIAGFSGWNTSQGWGGTNAAPNLPNLTLGVGNLDGDVGVDANNVHHPRMDLFAMTYAGLTAIRYDVGTQQWVPLTGVSTPLPTTSPATDWSQPPYSSTLQAGDVTGSAADEVLVRGADGLHTFTWTPANNGSFQEILRYIAPPPPPDGSPVPPPIFSDAAGWADPSKYSTIKTVLVTAGNKRAVIGRDKTGIRTVYAPQAGVGNYAAPSISYPAWAGGLDPTSHGDATDAGRAYKYINDQIAYKMNWPPVPVNPNDPVPDTAPTIRSKFVTGSGVSDWFDIATNIDAVQPSDALNVDRDTYRAVQREMADWARDVAVVWALFFASGSGQSLEQLMLTALVVGDVGYPVDEIQKAFNVPDKSKLWVWLSDLAWAVIGGIAFPELEAEEAADEATKTLVKAGNFAGKMEQSIVAAAAGAAITNYAPDNANKRQGEVNITADQINQHLVASFCTGIAFLYGSADQMATDLGLLTATGQMIRGLPLEPTYAYPTMVTQLSNQRTVWVAQQFASMNVKEGGWQMNHADADKASKISTPAVAVGGQVYAPGGLQGKCDDDHAQDAMNKLISLFGVDESVLAQPTWTFWDANGPSHTADDPNGKVMDSDGTNKMGTGGWRIPVGSNCS